MVRRTLRHTEWSVVHFVDGDVTGKFFKGDGEIIVRLDEQPSFFPLPPRPSFGSWRRERKRDGHARDANWLPDTATRPLRRPGWQARRRRWCNENGEGEILDRHAEFDVQYEPICEPEASESGEGGLKVCADGVSRPSARQTARFEREKTRRNS